MQTRNRDLVFTSTEDIAKIYTFGKVLGAGSFGKVVTARMNKNPEK
jgi:calcium-dependent protein kinase